MIEGYAPMDAVPICRVVTVHTFRGDRSKVFRQRLFAALDDERNGRGSGPSETDCLIFTGHSGISTDTDARTIYGFNPDRGSQPIWRVMQDLRSGRAYPGVVRDDSPVFTAAQQRGLTILRFDVALSPANFQTIRRRLIQEWTRRRKRYGVRSRYSYGYPDGDGDCNCTTWMECLGLPLLTGRMNEFVAVAGVSAQARRRFGVCR